MAVFHSLDCWLYASLASWGGEPRGADGGHREAGVGEGDATRPGTQELNKDSSPLSQPYRLEALEHSPATGPLPADHGWCVVLLFSTFLACFQILNPLITG